MQCHTTELICSESLVVLWIYNTFCSNSDLSKLCLASHTVSLLQSTRKMLLLSKSLWKSKSTSLWQCSSNCPATHLFMQVSIAVTIKNYIHHCLIYLLILFTGPALIFPSLSFSYFIMGWNTTKTPSFLLKSHWDQVIKCTHSQKAAFLNSSQLPSFVSHFSKNTTPKIK